MALQVEDYALVGDCETAALVGKDGSIDWLSWPDFSSPTASPRSYRQRTLILETGLRPHGGLLLTDFMPVRETHSDMVRMVENLAAKFPQTLSHIAFVNAARMLHVR